MHVSNALDSTVLIFCISLADVTKHRVNKRLPWYISDTTPLYQRPTTARAKVISMEKRTTKYKPKAANANKDSVHRGPNKVTDAHEPSKSRQSMKSRSKKCGNKYEILDECIVDTGPQNTPNTRKPASNGFSADREPHKPTNSVKLIIKTFGDKCEALNKSIIDTGPQKTSNKRKPIPNEFSVDRTPHKPSNSGTPLKMTIKFYEGKYEILNGPQKQSNTKKPINDESILDTEPQTTSYTTEEIHFTNVKPQFGACAQAKAPYSHYLQDTLTPTESTVLSKTKTKRQKRSHNLPQCGAIAFQENVRTHHQHSIHKPTDQAVLSKTTSETKRQKQSHNVPKCGAIAFQENVRTHHQHSIHKPTDQAVLSKAIGETKRQKQSHNVPKCGAIAFQENVCTHHQHSIHKPTDQAVLSKATGETKRQKQNQRHAPMLPPKRLKCDPEQPSETITHPETLLTRHHRHAPTPTDTHRESVRTHRQSHKTPGTSSHHAKTQPPECIAPATDKSNQSTKLPLRGFPRRIKTTLELIKDLGIEKNCPDAAKILQRTATQNNQEKSTVPGGVESRHLRRPSPLLTPGALHKHRKKKLCTTNNKTATMSNKPTVSSCRSDTATTIRQSKNVSNPQQRKKATPEVPRDPTVIYLIEQYPHIAKLSDQVILEHLADDPFSLMADPASATNKMEKKVDNECALTLKEKEKMDKGCFHNMEKTMDEEYAFKLKEKEEMDKGCAQRLQETEEMGISSALKMKKKIEIGCAHDVEKVEGTEGATTQTKMEEKEMDISSTHIVEENGKIDESSASSKPAVICDADRIHHECWEGVNGTRDHNNDWHAWASAYSMPTYNKCLLPILPYADIEGLC